MSAGQRFDAHVKQIIGFGIVGLLVGRAFHPDGARLGAFTGGVLGAVMDPEG